MIPGGPLQRQRRLRADRRCHCDSAKRAALQRVNTVDDGDGASPEKVRVVLGHVRSCAHPFIVGVGWRSTNRLGPAFGAANGALPGSAAARHQNLVP